MGLLAGFGDVVELDCDFELAPACLVDLEGLALFALDHAHVVGDGLVELELHAAQPVGYVDVVGAADEGGPAVQQKKQTGEQQRQTRSDQK